MYKTLNENASQMSTNTLAKHKTALKSLIMQFMITPISFFPAFVILLTILIPTEYSQRISYWSIMVGTTHSILNSIAVIVTYAEFRKALIFWRRTNKFVIAEALQIFIKRFQGVYPGFICEAFWIMGIIWKTLGNSGQPIPLEGNHEKSVELYEKTSAKMRKF
ncbi:hypothetical protein B9Z55_028282 [Caenorhabditis nigoni]|uniref:Uncharacterized protein n=1 Tax=Caenorhabditis nigoni TaxID=1611254 RepID=A0A2G5SCH0_9PELO|nr:hypothetical protein B9Z55_028282 [Caenorhabditis nigoni]